MPELFINGKDAVAVFTAQEPEGHGGGAFLAVFETTGGTEPALTAERDELQLTALRTGIHGSAEGKIAAVYHLIDVFHFNSSGMERILDDFTIVFENFL